MTNKKLNPDMMNKLMRSAEKKYGLPEFSFEEFLDGQIDFHCYTEVQLEKFGEVVPTAYSYMGLGGKELTDSYIRDKVDSTAKAVADGIVAFKEKEKEAIEEWNKKKFPRYGEKTKNSIEKFFFEMAKAVANADINDEDGHINSGFYLNGFDVGIYGNLNNGIELSIDDHDRISELAFDFDQIVKVAEFLTSLNFVD